MNNEQAHADVQTLMIIFNAVKEAEAKGLTFEDVKAGIPAKRHNPTKTMFK